MSTEKGVTPPRESAGHRNRLPCANANGLFENAIAKFTGIVEVAPGWEAGVAYKGRKIAYAAAGEYGLALADRSEIVRRYPAAASYYERALVCLMVEDYHHAAADFRKALEFAEHPGAHRGLALIHKARGDLLEALFEIEKAISLDLGALRARGAGISPESSQTHEAVAELAAFHFMVR